ncbi:DUF4276 family protein [Deefgea sp. CFH1-16]|uniref:DUF4276 family protein n=1 Tax=Deefgea sp. CFH1-16 TaxID=2675457 RepID=UPI0015F737D4|nr:DUF4276 family protein [Deefgea sp. CFH1-16]
MEAAILALVSQEQQARFIPYVQRYEFEALLFSLPEQAVNWLQGSAVTLANMQEAVRRCRSSELVNDSSQTSPSHRMKSLFAVYDKKLLGPDIVELAGLAAIRSECPRFDGWLSRLESLFD